MGCLNFHPTLHSHTRANALSFIIYKSRHSLLVQQCETYIIQYHLRLNALIYPEALVFLVTPLVFFKYMYSTGIHLKNTMGPNINSSTVYIYWADGHFAVTQSWKACC